ncbi:EpsG family protein, partial [Paenibacillus lupini]
MIFYICLFLLTVSIVLFSKKEGFVVIAFLLLGSTYAFRDSLAVDDGVYINAFEYINKGWKFDIEFTYIWISKLVYQMGMSYKAVFFIYAFLSFIFLYNGVKKYCKSNFEKALFLSAFYGVVFITSMSVMRQFLAGCIVFYALAYYIEQRKSKRSLVLIILASCFHYGASIAIPIFLFLIMKKSIPNRMKIFITVFCVLLGSVNVVGQLIGQINQYLPISYQNYSTTTGGNYSNAGGVMDYVLLLIFIVQLLISKRGAAEKNEIIEILQIGQMLYLCLIFMLAHAGVSSRLAFTFMPFITTLPYTFIKNFNISDRRLIGVICIYCMLGFFILSLSQFTSN